jgi:hypothetical protein
MLRFPEACGFWFGLCFSLSFRASAATRNLSSCSASPEAGFQPAICRTSGGRGFSCDINNRCAAPSFRGALPASRRTVLATSHSSLATVFPPLATALAPFPRPGSSVSLPHPVRLRTVNIGAPRSPYTERRGISIDGRVVMGRIGSRRNRLSVDRPTLLSNWSIVTKWKPEWRYDPLGTYNRVFCSRSDNLIHGFVFMCSFSLKWRERFVSTFGWPVIRPRMLEWRSEPYSARTRGETNSHFCRLLLCCRCFREIGQDRATALADLDCTLQRRDHLPHQAIAFMVLRAATEYMSRVNPLTTRLIPTMVPMAHVELLGQGRQITYARSSVAMPSKKIHPEPGNARNWKNTTSSSTPSTRKIAATTKVRDTKAMPGWKAR